MSNRVTDGVLQPLAGAVVSDVDLEDGWQPAQKSLAELRIADQIAANEFGDLAAAPHTRQLETLRQDLLKDQAIVPGLDIATVSHEVRIAVGKDDNVPSGE